jgi:hypothetical protein
MLSVTNSCPRALGRLGLPMGLTEGEGTVGDIASEIHPRVRVIVCP